MDIENHTVVKYGKESLTYTSGKEFYTTPRRAKQSLEKCGTATIPLKLTSKLTYLGTLTKIIWNTKHGSK